jgi:hypothetical protein
VKPTLSLAWQNEDDADIIFSPFLLKCLRTSSNQISKRTFPKRNQLATRPIKENKQRNISEPLPARVDRISPYYSIKGSGAFEVTDDRFARCRRPLTNGTKYDLSTALVLKSAEAEFAPFQKIWWEIKRANFDAIVMTYKGRFYEMFRFDAIFAWGMLKLHLTARSKEPICVKK